MSDRKCVLLHSGGLDSTTLMYYLREREKWEVLPISIFYGQRHEVELSYAVRARKHFFGDDYDPTVREIDLSDIKRAMKGGTLTDERIPVPEGHYADESMKATVSPNRNMLLLAAAGAYAIGNECQAIAYAAHTGDHAIYPDCRPSFISKMQLAFAVCHYTPIELLVPFMNKTKSDIVVIGYELGVPFELTWSCYKGGRLHCGKCGTCVERKEAFELAAVPDPTEYEGD